MMRPISSRAKARGEARFGEMVAPFSPRPIFAAQRSRAACHENGATYFFMREGTNWSQHFRQQLAEAVAPVAPFSPRLSERRHVTARRVSDVPAYDEERAGATLPH